MNLPSKIIAILFCTASIGLLGCSQQTADNGAAANSNSNASKASNANTADDNVEELRSLIQIPFEPDEVVYRVTNEADKKQRLVAVFVLTPANHRELEGRLSSGSAGKQQLVTVEQWFPPELKAMAEMTGETAISGTAFPATDFFQEPFTEGSIVFIPQTDYAVLELRSK
ncbi:MAG: hypothetical protein ACJ72Z_06600 [Pyrinomonadaceae bacterium]